MFKLVGPKTDLYSFKLIPYDYSNHLFGLFYISHIFNPVKGLFLDVLNYAHNIHVFILDVVVLVLPVIVFFWKLAGDCLLI